MAASRYPLAVARAAWRRRLGLTPLVVLSAGFLGTCWWLTEPLHDAGAPQAFAAAPPVAAAGVASVPAARPRAEWPGGRLEGPAAKQLLLDVLELAAGRIDSVEGYTATFRKRERIRGELGPPQRLAMKVRHRPFAVYLKFLEPHAGKEVVYAEGRHDNKVIAHGGGFSRLLVPRLAVPPDHPLALADSRHPVTEAGLSNLTTKLVRFRRLDLEDGEATTVLDRTTDDQGRTRLRSIHTHPVRHAARPFARVEVLYDPVSHLPVEIRSFDWPEPGDRGPLKLAEHYAYDDIQLDAELTALDFDPANPSYAFHRY